MAVKHFENDGKILCGTKGKNPNITNIKDDVTCKRCLKKLETPSEKTLKKKSKKKLRIYFVENKKFGYCLEINNDALLKLGDNLDDKIGVMIMFKNSGMSSCSMKFTGPVTQMIKTNELNFLREWFFEKRHELNNNLTVLDCKKAFSKN